LSFTIDQGNGRQPQKRSQLVLDRETGQVMRWEPFSSLTRGRQIRSVLRFAHTGEVAGIPGRTIALLATTGGTMLVWTGLALAWRRLRAWQTQNQVRKGVQVENRSQTHGVAKSSCFPDTLRAALDRQLQVRQSEGWDER